MELGQTISLVDKLHTINLVVTARTGKSGMAGLTLFLVERGTAGLRTRPVHCQGNIGSGTAFVILDKVVVGKSSIIGGLDKGFKVLHQC